MDAGETIAKLIIFAVWSAVMFGLGRATAPLTDPDPFAVNLPPPPKGMPEFCWQRKNGSLPRP